MQISAVSFQSINFFPKKMKSSYLPNVPHTLYAILLRQGYDLFTRDTEAFITKVFVHF